MKKKNISKGSVGEGGAARSYGAATDSALRLGTKLRELRRASGMTQAELSGDFITRNMLSKIESGSAVPSLPTIEYLAERLGVSPGYFFDSGTERLSEPLAAYKKLAAFSAIQKAYRRRDYSAALELCVELAVDSDDELNLIMADCYFQIGTENYKSGSLVSANQNFTNALRCAENTAYPTKYISAATVAYLNIISTVDLELMIASTSERVDTPSEQFNLLPERGPLSENGDVELYIYSFVLSLFSRGKFNEGAAILNSKIITNPLYSLHLSAKLALSNSDYFIAKQILDSLLYRGIDSVMLYHVYSDLEICARSVGDYKEAYEYTAKKLELFKAMHK